MAISREDVEHVALLGRLQLSPEEIETYTRQLQDIVGYAEKIQQLDLEGVEPMSHAVVRTNVMRKDEVGRMLDNEQALSNAPDKVDGYFRVPKVTEAA
jgi:aspartyl-tRNA(Asn)/glutamyl-tRNA(Gln) amidotransferase subunit C